MNTADAVTFCRRSLRDGDGLLRGERWVIVVELWKHHHGEKKLQCGFLRGRTHDVDVGLCKRKRRRREVHTRRYQCAVGWQGAAR